MSDSITIGLVLAVLIFWSVGAYNRMMRLRAHAIGAFAPMAGLLQQYLSLISTISPEHGVGHANDGTTTDSQFVGVASSALARAADEFSQSLKVAHSRPLDGHSVDALRGGLESLCVAWLQLQNLPMDLAGPVLPESLQMKWNRVAFEVEKARTDFNQAIAQYNHAIAQFPASLLARMAGFQPAHPL